MARSTSTPSREHLYRDSDFLKTARDRFKLADESDSPQAQRERDDIAFENGDQWPTDIKLARQGQQPVNGMPSVPARPTLVINKVREPARQILNEERRADIGVELVPADDFGDLGITPDDTEVTLREGLIRRIQRESIAADARTWAFKRAVIAGRGYYLVMTRYLPGASWDQEIYVHRIYNQASVLLDPAHEQPDGSDADWAFVGTWMPWDRYKAEYGTLADGKNNPFSTASDTDFVTMTEAYPSWYKADGDNRAVRVVDYWYTERTPRTLALLDDGTPAWEDELPEGVKPRQTRVVVGKQIRFCKIGGGVQELEKTDWLGPDMPIVKVLGEEVLPYDEQRRVEGVVRQARDSGMGFNAMVSKFVESVGLSAIPRDTIDPRAIEGFESWWILANTRTLPYKPYRSRDDEGREFRQPVPGNVDPNILSIAQGVSMFDELIKSTTAVPDPTLGNVDPALKSGKAIREVVANAAMSTSNFMDNLARSMRYEGQIINNLLYPIYGQKPGRLVRILTGEGDNEMMRIGEPAQSGQPQMQAQQANRAKALKVGKLTEDAHFNVIVKVTKAYDSRRTQEASLIGEMIAADPALMTWFGDLYLKGLDGPGHKQMAERARLMLAPPIQAMLAQQEQGQEPFPPAAQQQIAQLTEQITMLEAAIQELAPKAEGKQADADAKIKIEAMKAELDLNLETLRQRTELEKARMDAEKELALTRMENSTKIHVAEIAAKTKGVIQAAEMEHEATALAHTQQHESEQAALDRENLERQADRQAAEAERSRQFEADEAERNRQAQPEGDGA